MCIAPHRTGEYGCCVFCFIFFTFVTVFFLASRWHHISHAGPLSLCLGGPVVVFVFAFMHLSYEDWQGLWSSVVCISYSETWTSHTCVCVWLHCADMLPGTMRILPRLWVGATSCPRWSAALYTSNWKNELFFFFLRQDVSLYYILHLSHVIRAFLFWHLFWLVHLHLFWICASSNCLHHFEFTFIFRHYQVKETALCFATASASLSPLLHLCST